MPNFAYTARDRSGVVQTGNLEAVSEDEVITILQHRDLFVTSVAKQEAARASARSGLAVKPSSRRRMHAKVKLEDQVLLCQQLATLVGAGVPLLKSLEVVSGQVESRVLLITLDQVHRDVEAGRTFHDALAKHPAIFNNLWLNLVETGEASGHLADTLHQLAQHFEKSYKLQNEVKTAMTYPVFLVLASVVVLLVFMYGIIPKFETMFTSMNMELPLLTRLVLGASQAAQRYAVVLVFGTAASIWAVGRYLRTEAGHWMMDRLILRVPVMGQLMMYAQLAEFAQGMRTLLDSGVPLLSGLEILSRSASNRLYGEAIGQVRDAVKEGKSMAEPMSQSELFPPMASQMVLVGEEVGELGKMIGRVASYYEEQTETFIARMTKLFEPIAIVVMGSVVLVIVLSIFMPIFKMASGSANF